MQTNEPDSQPTDTELAELAEKLTLRGWINLLDHAGLSFHERQIIGWALRMAPRLRAQLSEQAGIPLSATAVTTEQAAIQGTIPEA